MSIRPPAVILLLAAGVCGCAARGTATPMAPEEPAADTADAADIGGAAEEPMDVDQAALSFERLEKELDQLLADGAAPADPPSPTSPTGQAVPPGAQPGEVELSPSPCTRACRALASMQRSAERLCELTGEDDPRCSSVNERHGRARERVQSRCPACQ